MDLREPQRQHRVAGQADGRRFAIACLAGGIPAVVLFAVLVTHGGSFFFPLVRVARPPQGGTAGAFRDYFDVQGQSLSNFFDVQGRALLSGRWNVAPRSIWSTEHFDVGGRTFIYFGPVPALLRWPILAITRRLDGRLTSASLTVAYATAILGVARLLWTARRLVGRTDPVLRGEAVAVGLTIFAFATGSTLLFPASVPWSYHEPVLWGAALTLLAFNAIIAAGIAPSRRTLGMATLLAVLALLTRVSVGVGPIIALMVIGLVRAANSLRPSSERDAGSLATSGGFIAAAGVPLGLYALINRAKFHSLFGVPWDRWGAVLRGGVQSQQLLHQNSGSLFNARYIPTTFVQYFRVDGFRVAGDFPFVDFPARLTNVFLGLRFGAIFPTTSIPASMPLLVLLGGVGLVVLARRRLIPGAAAVVGACVLGASVGAALTLSYGWIDNRFLLDLIPVVVLLAVIGFQAGLRWSAAARTSVIRAVTTVVAVAALVGIAVNIALTLRYQHRFAFTFV